MFYYVGTHREEHNCYSTKQYFYSLYFAILFNPETKEISKKQYLDTREKLPRNLEYTEFPHATGEVLEVYERTLNVRKRLAERKELQELARKCHLNSYQDIVKLRKVYPWYWNQSRGFDWEYTVYNKILNLLQTEHFNSSLEEEAMKKVRSWIVNSESRLPLSYKEVKEIL